MTTRIAPAVGLNLLGQDGSERNQDATVFVANLAPQVTEELLRELCAQAGPVANVYVPKDRVTNLHQGYGFVEFASEGDVDYAVKVLNDRDRVTLYGRDIRVKRASQDKRSSIVGANLFIGNLDPDVDENLLYDTFSKFGVALNPKIMRDSGNSRGFGFISFDCFEASDEAIEVMNGQYLCNRQITVSYAYKKDTNGERHGTPAERALAAASSSSRPRVHAPMPPPQQLIGRPHIHQMAMHPPQQLIGGPPMHHMPPPQQPIGRPPMHYMSRPPLPRSYF